MNRAWLLEHRACDPYPQVGTVLEVGSPPDPVTGRWGDLLSFEAVGGGVWVERHNRRPRGRVVDSAVVAFWAPLRVAYRPSRRHWQGWRPFADGSPRTSRLELALAGAPR